MSKFESKLLNEISNLPNFLKITNMIWYISEAAFHPEKFSKEEIEFLKMKGKLLFPPEQSHITHIQKCEDEKFPATISLFKHVKYKSCHNHIATTLEMITIIADYYMNPENYDESSIDILKRFQEEIHLFEKPTQEEE